MLIHHRVHVADLQYAEPGFAERLADLVKRHGLERGALGIEVTEETLARDVDEVAATLENLAARGDRMVGVVTHVAALAERIPVRYEVRKDARSAHVERVGL